MRIVLLTVLFLGCSHPIKCYLTKNGKACACAVDTYQSQYGWTTEVDHCTVDSVKQLGVASAICCATEKYPDHPDNEDEHCLCGTDANGGCEMGFGVAEDITPTPKQVASCR